MTSLAELGYVYDADHHLWCLVDVVESEFGYTDGEEVENRLFHILSNTRDLSITSPELEAMITDWPSLYHLSDRRSNLLKPLHEMVQGRILEVGAGCGAITRYLGEQNLDVVALEGSKARAKIAAQRCRDLPNVAVVSQTLQNLTKSLEVDVVLLIGVLEYARIYFPLGDHADAVDAMLHAARKQLAPGGRIIIGIENQLGLKYLSGYNEDHLGVPFAGLEDRYRTDGVITFGRFELSSKLSGIGLPTQSWWFPFPDYKLPTLVVSDKACTVDVPFDISPMLEATVAADLQRPTGASFSLQRAWRTVGRNRLFGELANSFLVVASADAQPPGNILAWYFGLGRRPGFRKSTVFRRIGEEIRVERTPLYRDLSVDSDQLGWQLPTDTWIDGRQWHSALVHLLGYSGWSQGDLNDWAQVWWTTLIEETRNKSAPLLQDDQNLLDVLVDGSYLDAIPRNLILTGGHGQFFDLEWVAPGKLPLGYLAFRGIVSSLLDLPACAMPQAGTDLRVISIIAEICRFFGLSLTSEKFSQFWEIESNLQRIVNGRISLSFEELARTCLSTSETEATARPIHDVMVEELGWLAGLKSSGMQQTTLDLVNLRRHVSELLDSADTNLRFIQRLADEQRNRFEFDTKWYREYYSDVASSGIDPFVHYLAYGMKEGRKPHP